MQRRITDEKEIVLVLALMMLAGLVACGGKSGTQQNVKQQNALVGRWELVDVQTEYNKSAYYIGEKFELFSDGTGISSAGYEKKWIAENGRLKMGDDVCSYKISGNKLILTDDDGTIETYQRVQQ